MVGVLLHVPAAREHEVIRKVKIALADYEDLSPRERMRYLVTEIERETKAPLKVGIGRFEEPLAILGLGGSVPDDTKRNMLQFAETRNVLVHNAGKADRRFRELCPWVEVDLGGAVPCGIPESAKFASAASNSLLAVTDRLKAVDPETALGEQAPASDTASVIG